MTDRIDRYARGELQPLEARALAQQALDSPALFDELTDAALVKAALTPETVRTANTTRFPTRIAYIAAGAVAAAALIWILLPHRTTPAPALTPVLQAQADTAHPVLLASGLQTTHGTVFRSDEGGNRAPRAAGSISSITDGLATLDLGSVDGLAKDSELQVFRGGDRVGRLRVNTVFRDRARANMIEGNLQPKDEVRVGAEEHLKALHQRVDSAFNSGDADTAIKAAEEAVHWGESASLPPSAMAESWNQLAVLHMLRGEYDGAEPLLLRAASAVQKTDPAYAQIQNNIGVLAELRGDRAKAKAHYSDALNARTSTEERQTVDRNLTRVSR